MGRFSKTKKVKKKGPKGKKARAKAKLERQWGEEAVEKTPLRKGKSRLLDTVASKERKAVKEQHESDDEDPFMGGNSDSDESREGSEGGDEYGTNAYSSLLQSIHKKAGQQASSDKSEQTDSEDEEMDEEDVEMDHEDSDDDDDDDGTKDIYLLPVDPFTERFVQSASLPLESVPEKAATTKLDLVQYGLPHDEHLDLQVTSSVLRPILSSASPPKWKDLASAYLRNTRPVLQNRWQATRKKSLDADQKLLMPFLSSYADLLWTTGSKKASAEQLVALHILQHVLTSRSRIQRNSRRLRDQENDAKNTEEEDEEAVYRDQGFTRPTVLILLPTRGTCYTFVKEYLLPLLGEAPAVEKMDRFETEYGKPEMEEAVNDAAERRRQKVLREKGKDWLELYGDDTNNDDDFRMGLSFKPKGGKRADANADTNISVKLFTDFFRSDIILASPVAMKTTAVDSDQQMDYLSSIEICVLGRSDVLMMQNWDHVMDVLSLLNKQPKDTNDTDFSRVRPYLLDEKGAHWRQLIFLAPFLDPLLLSTFKRHAKSRDGQVRMRRRTPADEASIAQVLLPTRQVFQRVPCNSFATQSADRLKYFVGNVLPQLEKHKQRHTLIYVPSYFEFIALRNELLKREHVFAVVNEYSRASEVTRGRARFLQGRKPWMLYTGRAHFFLRHVIKGARHVIFYGLPEHSEFYPDHVNRLNEGLDDSKIANEEALVDASASSLVLFNKYESHALERIVGSSNCSRMIKGEKNTFLFST